MAKDIGSLDSLQQQLQTTGLQQKNFPLYQLLNQLIKFLRQSIDLSASRTQALQTTINNFPPVSKLINTGYPFGTDGEEGPEGLMGVMGKDGMPGPQGGEANPGMPGIDGTDGIDGDPGIPGPQGFPGNQGIQGPPGLFGIDGLDGEEGSMSLVPGPVGPPGVDGAGDWDTTVVKTADESDSAGVMQDDDELFCDLALDSSYIMELVIIYGGNNASGDYKWRLQIGGTLVAVQWIGYTYYLSAALAASAGVQSGALSAPNTLYPTADAQAGTDALNTKLMFHVHCTFTTPSAWSGDGKLRYRFAILTAAVGRTCTTFAGSMFRLKKLT